jgi:hypothetical protein
VLQLGTVEGWVVTHDGETLKSGFKNDFEAVEWMHKRHSYSIDHAVRHEGYDIVLVKDGKVVYSYKQEAKKRHGLGAKVKACEASDADLAGVRGRVPRGRALDEPAGEDLRHPGLRSDRCRPGGQGFERLYPLESERPR